MSTNSTPIFSKNITAYIQFIESGNVKNAYRRLAVMRNLGKYENKINNEFASFSSQQMQVFYEQYALRLNTAQGAAYLSILNDYLVWLMDQGEVSPIQFAEHPLFTLVSATSFDKKIMSRTSRSLVDQISRKSAFNSMLFSPRDLEDYCETFFADEPSRMAKAICCLAWSGIPISFIKTIRIDMVDETNKTVSFKDDAGHCVVVSISDDYCMQAIHDAAYYDGCYKIGKGGAVQYFVPYREEFSQYLIRPLKTGKAISDEENRIKGIMFKMKPTVNKVQKQLPLNHPYKDRTVNVQSIYNCGRYYRFYQQYNGAPNEEKLAMDEFWSYGLQHYLIWKSVKPQDP